MRRKTSRRPRSRACGVERLESRCLLSFGDLDPLFGATGNGVRVTDFNSGLNDESAQAIVIGSDGKLVVAGAWGEEAGANADFAVARYSPRGVLDNTFGSAVFGATSGKSHVFFGAAINSSHDYCTDVALQPDGKIVLVGYTDFGTLGGFDVNNFAVARLNVDGSLDTSFSGDGKLTISFGGDDRASAVAVRPDGRIVVAGTWDEGAADFIVASINSNGTLDATFGSGQFGAGSGRANVFFGAMSAGSQDFCTDMALQPDGKIVLAGYTDFGTLGGFDRNDFAVARLNVNGSIDNTFDVDGKQKFGFGADDRASALGIDVNNKIVVAGSWDGGSSDFAVARLTSAGVLDTTFGNATFGASSGRANVFFGASIESTHDFCTDLALRPDGGIVLAGYFRDGVALIGSNHFAVARVTGTGSLDLAFDEDGRKTIALGGSDQAFGVASAPDGSIVLAGDVTDSFSGRSDFAMVRLRGALDLGFNGTGLRTTNWGNTDTARAVAVDAAGRAVVAGSWDGGTSDFAVARYRADGTLDPSFGAGFFGAGSGLSNVTFGIAPFGGAEFATDVAVDANGKIVVVGYTSNVNGVPAIGGSDLAVCRLNDTGTLDTSFSGDGKLTINFGFDDRATGVAIRPDGKIVVCGYLDGGSSDMAVVQINPDGTFDATFGNVGAFGFPGASTVNFGPASADFANDVALQPDGKIVLAGYTTLNAATSGIDIAILRLNAGGTLDTSFSFDGMTTRHFNDDDYANAVAIDAAGNIVVVGQARSNPDLLLAIFNPNGTFQFSSEEISGAVEVATDVLIQPDGKIVVSGYSDFNGADQFLVERYKANGSRDSNFEAFGTLLDQPSGGSKLLLPSSGGDARSYGIALQPNGHLLLAGVAGTDFAVARLSSRMIAASATFDFQTVQQLRVWFSAPPVGLTASDFTITNLTTSTTIPAADISVIDLLNGSVILRFPGQHNSGVAGVLPDGRYRLTLPEGVVTDSAGNASVGTLELNFFFLMGDANRDANVNLQDFNVLAANFGLAGRTFSQGNFNYDAAGNVNLADFNILASRFGTVLGPDGSLDRSPFSSIQGEAADRYAQSRRLIALLNEQLG